MSIGRQASGYREHRDGLDYVVFERTFRAPIWDVWAAVTEPDRLERWVGTWTGDPASGEVVFRMTAEGEDVAPETYRIEVCEPPRHLRTRSWLRRCQARRAVTDRRGRLGRTSRTSRSGALTWC